MPGRLRWWATFASVGVQTPRCWMPSGLCQGAVAPACFYQSVSLACGNSAKPYGTFVKHGFIGRAGM